MDLAPGGEWAGSLHFQATPGEILSEAMAPDEGTLNLDRKPNFHAWQSAPDSVEMEMMDRRNQWRAFNRLYQEIVGACTKRSSGFVGPIGRNHHEDGEETEALGLTDLLREIGAIDSRKVERRDQEIG